MAFIIAGTVLGTIVGARFGKSAVGAIVGTLAGGWVYDVINHPRFKHSLAMVVYAVNRPLANIGEAFAAVFFNVIIAVERMIKGLFWKLEDLYRRGS